MSDPDINWYKDKLAELLRRVPARVNNGGVQTAQAYKKAVQYANKQRESSRPNLANLREAVQKLQSYE